ncbi:MAG TPA: hypothetical protein VGL81_14405 [Polyangiaceae bacterium]|jgi:hypothetical protein
MAELIVELRAIAGAPWNSDAFTVPAAAVDAPAVRVEYREGTSHSIVLRTPYGARAATTAGHRDTVVAPHAARPLAITLRPETTKDARSKSRGIDREVQTGDAEFDAAVYVDTAAPDEAVVFVLGPEAVRAATLALLGEAGFSTVVVDDTSGDVVATLTSFPKSVPADRAARVLESFRALAWHVPTVQTLGATRRDRGQRVLLALGLAALAGFVLEIALTFALAPDGCARREGASLVLDCVQVGGRDCCAPMGVGAIVGVPAGLVAGLVAASFFRGRSDSSRRRVAAFIFVAALAFELTTTVVEAVMR